jgi:hypothetical protein
MITAMEGIKICRWFGRLSVCALACLGLTAILTSQVRAAQAWSCICDGERKRFLASTRHCEFRSKLPKGETCTLTQRRAVYGPACRAEGCRLPPLKYQ